MDGNRFSSMVASSFQFDFFCFRWRHRKRTARKGRMKNEDKMWKSKRDEQLQFIQIAIELSWFGLWRKSKALISLMKRRNRKSERHERAKWKSANEMKQIGADAITTNQFHFHFDENFIKKKKRLHSSDGELMLQSWCRCRWIEFDFYSLSRFSFHFDFLLQWTKNGTNKFCR